jgi:DNA replication protein DnaC
MIRSDDQVVALEQIDLFLRTPDQPTFALHGDAGTGKTSLLIELVARVVHSAGYNLLSFTRAFAVLNCQSALVCFLLRSASHASTSCFNTR